MRQGTKKIKIMMISMALSMVLLASSCAFAAAPERILSIAPAGTEILFDLGLGYRVVGVTRFCTWPPEAQAVPSVGDMMHVGLEAIMEFRPDLVLVTNMNYRIGEQARALGFRVVTVHQDDFEQICYSILRVGRESGVEEAARLRVEELREIVRGKTVFSSPGADIPRVLIVVGRDPLDEVLRRMHVAGRGSFYNDLLTKAGAKNAYTGDAPYAQVSLEGLLRLDPDVIIELIGTHHGTEVPTYRIASLWNAVPDLRAAQNGRVSIIKGDFALRPGPRYPQILSAFIKAIQDGVNEIFQ